VNNVSSAEHIVKISPSKSIIALRFNRFASVCFACAILAAAKRTNSVIIANMKSIFKNAKPT
jgi:hypothetical protein